MIDLLEGSLNNARTLISHHQEITEVIVTAFKCSSLLLF